MEEKEVKIKIEKARFGELKKKIAKEAESVKKICQRDVYFDDKKLKITNLARGLRVRFENYIPTVLDFKSIFFSPSEIRGIYSYIEEISLKLPLTRSDFGKLNQILERLGFKNIASNKFPCIYEDLVILLREIDLTPKIFLTKQRTQFVKNKVIYTFDYIQELGYFLEVETKEKIDPLKILERLLEGKAYGVVKKGYNEMAAGNLENYLPNNLQHLLFKINPGWNVLESERNLVKKYFSRS